VRSTTLGNARQTLAVIGYRKHDSSAFERRTLAGKLLKEAAPREPRSISLTSLGTASAAGADLEALLGLTRDGRLKPVIDRVLPLEQAAEGERLLEDREVIGKVLLKP